MSKFKVGDRVKILSDDRSVITQGVKSAIGEIGVVNSTSGCRLYYVKDLPQECYVEGSFTWCYCENQLELVKEEEMEYQEITIDNIKDVLKHNGYHLAFGGICEGENVSKYKNDNRLVSFINNYGDGNSFIIQIGGSWSFKNYDINEFIEMAIKKLELKPLPIFDFVQYLLDNGFTKKGDLIYNDADYKNSTVWFNTISNKVNSDVEIELTQANADKLIEASKVLNSLELNKGITYYLE